MRSKHLVLFYAVLLASSFSTPAISLAEGEDPTTQTVNDLQNAGNTLVHKIKQAMRGERGATDELIESYAVPAAMALILIIIGYLFASFMGRVVGTQVTKRIDKTVGRFSGRVVQNGIMVLVVLSALGYFGIDVTSFAAILAATGFAVGMALQGTLSNFAAGIMLLVFRPFQIDDYIDVGGVEGTVEEIDLFTTKLNTVDNRHIIVPNGNVYGETMINYSRNSMRRVDVNVGVAYDADIAYTRRVLQSVVDQVPGAMQTPEPVVYLKDLGDSAVNWQCRIWTTPQEYWAVREQLTESVKNALDDAGISIPFPQMDIHVAGKVLAKAA